MVKLLKEWTASGGAKAAFSGEWRGEEVERAKVAEGGSKECGWTRRLRQDERAE